MFNLTKFIEALNNMGVKVLIQVDKLMKELGTDNAIQIIGLLAIAKGEVEEIKERKLI